MTEKLRRFLNSWGLICISFVGTLAIEILADVIQTNRLITVMKLLKFTYLEDFDPKGLRMKGDSSSTPAARKRHNLEAYLSRVRYAARNAAARRSVGCLPPAGQNSSK